MPGSERLAGPGALSGPADAASDGRLCFAYGSNLDEALMQRRCPGAEAITTYVLHGWRLCFRGYADLEPVDGAQTPGVLYRITPDGERQLDLCEGVSPDSISLYRKETFIVTNAAIGQTEAVLFYTMNETRTFPPDPVYYRLIQRAYQHWGFSREPLEDALRRALGTSV